MAREAFTKETDLDALTVKYQVGVLETPKSNAGVVSSPLKQIFENRIALSITETAAYLGLSSKKIERLCKTGELKSKLAGRRVLIPVTAIEAWLNS